MRNKRIIIGILTAFCIGLLGQGLMAEPKSNIAMVYYVDAKDGKEAEFLEALTEHAQWRRDAGDPWTWHVYQVVVGEHLGRYIIRSAEHTWADFDDYAQLNVKASAHWNETVGPYIAEISNALSTWDTDVNKWMPQEEIKYISVNSYMLKPGKWGEFSEAIGRYHEVIMEHDYDTNYGFAWAQEGGTADVHLVLPYSSYADMEGPEESLREFMTRVVGEEEAKALGDQFNSNIRSSTSALLIYIPELSILHDK